MLLEHSVEARRHAAPTTASRGAREGGAYHPLSPTAAAGTHSRVARGVSCDSGTRWRNGKRTSRRGRDRGPEPAENGVAGVSTRGALSAAQYTWHCINWITVASSQTM
jgi:hypothetical protein